MAEREEVGAGHQRKGEGGGARGGELGLSLSRVKGELGWALAGWRTGPRVG